MRATGDICIFAADDVVYVDNYANIIESAFARRPDADVVVFNLKEKTTRYVIKNNGKIRYFNYLRYGTARVEAKGQWIAFLDSNDIWSADKLINQITFIENNVYHFSSTCYEKIDTQSKVTGVKVTGSKTIRKKECLTIVSQGASQ